MPDDSRPAATSATTARGAGLLRALQRPFGSAITRLTLSVAAGALGVFALALTVVHHLLEQDLAERTGRQMHSAVTRAAADVDARLAQRLDALQAAAEEWHALPEPRPQPRAMLARWAVLASMFDVVIVTDAQGRVVADVPARPERANLGVADSEYFKRALDSRGAVVGAPYMGRVIKRPLLPFSVALRDADGRFQGVIMGALELNGGRFFADLATDTIGDSGRFIVVTRQAQLLLHPDPKMLLGQLPDRAQDQFIHRATDGWAGWARLPDDGPGAGDVVAARPLRHAGWVVLGVLPAHEANAALRRLDQVVLLTGLGGALLIGLLGWWVAQVNLAPLARLRRQVDAIDAGQRNAAVSDRGPAEVAGVARAFNRLLLTRERAEQALAAREAFHRTLSDGAPLGLLLIDAHGDCTYANAGALALTGRNFDALCGRGWRACVYGDDADPLRGAWRRAVTRRESFELTLRLLRPDHSTAWTLLRASPVTEGGQTLYLAALLDVSAERAARETAQRAQRHAQTILDTIQDALFVLDGHGRVIDLSPAAERMCGWTRAQALATPMARVTRLIDEVGTPVPFDAFGTLAHFTCERWQAETVDGRRAVDIVWRRFDDGRAAAAGDGGGVLTLRDAQERRAAAQAAQWAATHDALTALPNRRAFDVALDRAHALFRDGGDNAALLMLDLDGFKSVNDGGGHEAGDAMLRAVAQVLRTQVRATDLAARIGGDEFAVLLTGCSDARAAAIADGIREAVGRLTVERDGRRYGVGVSIGVSAFARGDETADCPLRRADAAAYAAKRAGRNRVELARLPRQAGASAPASAPEVQATADTPTAGVRRDCEGCEAAPGCDAIRAMKVERP
jgi:diguanylate cyclase (GGDEF)-like protein/PAS domain S-box-containing protein